MQETGNVLKVGGKIEKRDLKDHPHSDTLLLMVPHLLQQATTPNSSTPYELMESNYFKLPQTLSQKKHKTNKQKQKQVTAR